MDNSMKMTGSSHNRTGMSSSEYAEQMRQVPSLTHPSRADGEMKKLHALYLKETHSLGSVPPPANLKGVATTAKQALKGNKATALIDKIAERLAFERSGVRLYEALLEKFEASSGFKGGPDRDALQTIHDEEHEHARMLRETLEQLGADPTALTPSADLVAIESSGLGTVLNDPRTSVGQCLHALMVAELADGEGWTLLRSLAEETGQKQLAKRFAQAEQEEERHLEQVRAWLTAHARHEAELV